jgi:predicted Ser/Thr protein kinase
MSILIDGIMTRIQASFTIVAPPGTKRIIYAHEDCVCTTMHVTNEIDLEKIEEHFIAENEQQYLEFVKQNEEIEQLRLPLD